MVIFVINAIMKRIYIYFLFLIILASCSQQFIHKTYIPTPPTINYIKDKDFQDLKIKGNFSIFETQYTKALNEKWGINSNLILNSGFGINAGLVKYKHFEKSYFEILSGIGYNFRKSIIERGLGFHILIASKYYHHNLQSEYLNYYLQPSYLFKLSKNCSFGFSINNNLVFFDKYQYMYTLENYQGSEEQYIFEADSVNENNILGLLIEPTITFKFSNSGKTSFFIQLGYTFNALYNISNYYLYRSYDEIPVFHFKHPNFRPWIINFGFQINLQKNNDNQNNQ